MASDSDCAVITEAWRPGLAAADTQTTTKGRAGERERVEGEEEPGALSLGGFFGRGRRDQAWRAGSDSD